MRSSQAIINLSNLIYNFRGIRRKVGKAGIMAVVKANAYGHGVEEVVNSLNSLGKEKPEYFGVATVDEGIEVRSLKVKQPILVFDPVESGNAINYFIFSLMPAVFTKEHLKVLAAVKKMLNSVLPIKVHVKVDTGMNRLGVNFNEAFDFIKMLNEDSRFKVEGVFTHFASADERNKKFAYLQLKRFDELIGKLKSAKIKHGLAHTANSGAIMDLPGSYYDMVRPGCSLYGYYPSIETSESVPLKQVMTITSVVNSIKEINYGESVSYGRKFIAKKPTRIISVPFGYADGFYRGFTNNSRCLIGGNYFNQIGTVTMDRIIFDIGKNQNVRIGNEVVLMGKQKGKEISVWEWAERIGTIPYEITCNISQRVPRIYLR